MAFSPYLSELLAGCCSLSNFDSTIHDHAGVGDVQVMSYGMVLCASDDAHGSVEPVAVPADVPLGEKIQFEGYTGVRGSEAR